MIKNIMQSCGAFNGNAALPSDTQRFISISIMFFSINRQKPAMVQHAHAAPHGKRKRSLGVTLIEAMAAMGVMAGATVGLVALVDDAM